MTKRELYKTRDDGVTLYRTYSTDGFQIRKVGTDEIYDEAIDVETAAYGYEETSLPIGEEFDGATETDYQNALREMGVQV